MNHLINLIIVTIVTVIVIINLPKFAYIMYKIKREDGYSIWRFIFSKNFIFWFVLGPFTVLLLHAVIYKSTFWILNLFNVKFQDTFTSDDKANTTIYYLLLFYLTMAIVGSLFPMVYKDKDSN